MIHFSIGDGRDTKVDLDWMVLNDALNSANILGGGPLDPIKIDNFLRWSVSDGQGNWNPPSKLAEITSGKTLSMKLDQMEHVKPQLVFGSLQNYTRGFKNGISKFVIKPSAGMEISKFGYQMVFGLESIKEEFKAVFQVDSNNWVSPPPGEPVHEEFVFVYSFYLTIQLPDMNEPLFVSIDPLVKITSP